jgi:amidophosphoribosyltransferase
MAGQAIRKQSVRKKLNVIPHEFSGKNVLIVDDSIVRGNTSSKIVEMARDAGANKVYFASAAPPVIHPNVYGIDMPAVTEFIANGRSVEEIADTIGVDRLFYQNLDDLISATSIGPRPPERFDCSCFDADYITGDVTPEYLSALETARNDAAKQVKAVSAEAMDLHNDE